MVLLRTDPMVRDFIRNPRGRGVLDQLAEEQQVRPSLRNMNTSIDSPGGPDPQGPGFDPFDMRPPPPPDLTRLDPAVRLSPIVMQPEQSRPPVLAEDVPLAPERDVHKMEIQNGPFGSVVRYRKGKADLLSGMDGDNYAVPIGDDSVLARLQRDLYSQQERALNKQETGYEDVPGTRRLAAMLNPTQAGSPGMNAESFGLMNQLVGERRRQDIANREVDARMLEAKARADQAKTNRQSNAVGVKGLIEERVKGERQNYIASGGSPTTWATIEEPRRRLELAAEFSDIDDTIRGKPVGQPSDNQVGTQQQTSGTMRSPADAAADARAESLFEKNRRPLDLALALSQTPQDANNPMVIKRLVALLSQGDAMKNRQTIYGQMAALAASGGRLPQGFGYERDAETPFGFYLRDEKGSPLSGTVRSSSWWPFPIGNDERSNLTNQINILATLANEMKQQQTIPGGQR